MLRNRTNRTDGTPEPCSGIDTTGPTCSPWSPSSASASSPSWSSSTACSTTTRSSTASATTWPAATPGPASRGRPSTPVEVILRMLVVMRLYGWSYEQAEYFVNDSLVLRQFCRVYLEKVPDDTTLIRWANTIGPGDPPGAQRPGRPAGPVAEGDPRPQAPGRHHGGRDGHPLPHRQRPDRRRRAGRLAAAAAGQGRAGRGRLRAEGGVPQPGPHRPQAVAAAAPDRPPQGRAGPRGVEGGLRPARRHGQADRGPGPAGARGPPRAGRRPGGAAAGRAARGGPAAAEAGRRPGRAAGPEGRPGPARPRSWSRCSSRTRR